jgi:hypothetical protein
MIRPPRAPLLALALALSADGCRARRAPPPLEVPGPPPVSAEIPVDRTLPGELAEGTEKAFGLTLPRIVLVRARFDDVVFGMAEVSPDKVANYVRQRVSANRVETGPVKTVFSRATVRGQPGVEIDIEVLSRGGSTELQVRNLSLWKTSPGLTDEERWRAAGFKPDGTPLDTTHLH